VSTTTRPVTHDDETAVNNAGTNPALSPLCDDIGSIRRIVPITIMLIYPRAISLVCENFRFIPKPLKF
jgi:hypothetical protein